MEAPPFDVVCFSHLRWGFVYQRPQHLLSRCARDRRVFYVEEPIEGPEPGVRTEAFGENVLAVVPVLPGDLLPPERWDRQRSELQPLIRDLFAEHAIDRYVLWYYTPGAISVGRDLSPLAVVYDCMDELSAFDVAPTDAVAREEELLATADLVFAGGRSLYEAKRDRHPSVHLFPSSVDVEHFRPARGNLPEPEDQATIARPRLGYYGVIDERLDLDLVAGVAARRPEWQVVMVGPVLKIDERTLPSAPNIHWLGAKTYEELPAYVGGWDVAIMPFAHNAATRFISPTKTPEYLAAGRPVVSTSIRDVVDPYGAQGLVRIADDVEGFVEAAEAAMREDAEDRIARADAFLADQSWDITWARMEALIEDVVATRLQASA